jgi:hypothetical protein
MILAVPEQHTTVASGAGIPERTTVLTWWRWWCSSCRAGSDGRSSHPDMALRSGDRHADAEQCDVVGQMALFALVAGGAR